MRIKLDYPSPKEEILILERFQKDDPLKNLEAVTTPEEILHLQKERAKIYISQEINYYIVNLANATRNSSKIRFGASPRSSLHLMRAAQALAAIRGRDFVLPDDVKELFIPVLAHRVVIGTKERLKGASPQKLLEEILAQIEIPTREISK